MRLCGIFRTFPSSVIFSHVTAGLFVALQCNVRSSPSVAVTFREHVVSFFSLRQLILGKAEIVIKRKKIVVVKMLLQDKLSK